MREGAQTTRWLRPRLPQLGVLVAYNGVAQIVPMIAAFALTPLLLDRLGLDRFGIWSLALLIISALTQLDGGVSASLTRFFAIYGARRDRAAAGRLMAGSLVFFVLLGVLLTLIALPLAPSVVPLLHVPRRLNGEAVLVLRWVPVVAALGLISDSTSAVLEGNGQFRALATSTVLSTAVFVVAVVLLVHHGDYLGELMIASALRYAVLAGATLAFGMRQLTANLPLLPSRATLRELWRYSSRVQLSALTGLVNSELDAFVIAAVLPVRYVGLYAIGLQAASAARSLPLYAFPPMLTRLAQIFSTRGREATVAEFARLERGWLPVVLAYGSVAIAGIGFSVTVWLGDRYRLAAFVALILLSCYVVHVALTGVRTCYVRAVGRPGLETRYSSVWTVGNAVITVPLALVLGVLGVVAATAVTGIIASVFFVILCRRREGLPLLVPTARWWGRAALAACITIAGELAILQTALHGFPALVLSAVPGLVALLLVGARAWRAPVVRVAS